MKALVTVSRFLVGVLFIISGLIKANDPLGFSYKLDEYFAVFGTDFLTPISLYLSIFICVFEVVLGIAAIMGARIKTISWLLLLMIVFFTFLTFYSAYFNKVTDCGCFGDAVKLTPWQSFWKDIFLLFFILVIFFDRSNIKSVLGPKGDSALLALTFFVTLGFTVWCYNHLPVKDFRPYKVGTHLLSAMKLPPGAKSDVYETFLYYEKDGVVNEFTMDNYPWEDSTWVWKETKTKLVVKGDVPAIRDFGIKDADGNDYTEEFLVIPEFNFFLISYDVTKANKNVQPKVNDFAMQCEKENIPFIGITATSPENTDLFRHEVQAMYDFYYCDGTALKTMIRSNPGLILLKDGVVAAMWHFNDFPSFDDFRKQYLAE